MKFVCTTKRLLNNRTFFKMEKVKERFENIYNSLNFNVQSSVDDSLRSMRL